MPHNSNAIYIRTFLNVLLLLLACISVRESARAQSVVLVGTGSSVPLPLYRTMIDEYHPRNGLIRFDYLPIGTTEGLVHLSNGVGDFAAGEIPLKAQERGAGTMEEIPVVLIGIVPIYNIPGITQDLKFSGELLAEIFLGEIKNWSSPRIAHLNPGINLPDVPITVLYRPGGKGTNYVFSEFLAKASARFRSQIGTTASPPWPIGRSADTSSDMVQKVKNQVGSIGYVELQYATQAKIPYGRVLNAAGRFIKATPESIVAACREAESPEWNHLSASLTNGAGVDSYPITSFSWIYFRTKTADQSRAAALAELLTWMVSDGQQLATRLGYSELPVELRAKVKARMKSLR